MTNLKHFFMKNLVKLVVSSSPTVKRVSHRVTSTALWLYSKFLWWALFRTDAFAGWLFKYAEATEIYSDRLADSHLPDAPEDDKERTLRELLDKHRQGSCTALEESIIYLANGCYQGKFSSISFEAKEGVEILEFEEPEPETGVDKSSKDYNPF